MNGHMNGRMTGRMTGRPQASALAGLAVEVALGLTLGLSALLAGCEPGLAGPGAAAASASAAAPAPAATARGVVELPTGVFELLAPQDGTVAVVAVKEGQDVHAGQLLLRLDGEAQQQEQRIVMAELDVARARLQAQQARLPAAERLLQRTDEAQRADAVEVQRVDEARQALADLRAAVAVGQAELALAQGKVAQAQAASKRLTLTAPTAAQVLRVHVQAGSRVAAQAARPLMLLLPAQALRVRAELNEAYAQRVRPGQAASVYADGDLPAAAAGTAFAARLVRVSPLFGASRLDPDAQLLERYGRDGWQALETAWQRGEIGSRACMQGQVALLAMSEAEFTTHLAGLALDPQFASFVAAAAERGLPVQVVSDGLDRAIHTMLARAGLGALPVYANHLVATGPRHWQLLTPHARSDCRRASGHCKCARAAAEQSARRQVLYIGDGSSDFCVAPKADFVLAKDSLLAHCREQGIAHHPIAHFGDALAWLEAAFPTLMETS